MTLYDTIRTAILEHLDREAVVYLADGREIVVTPDFEAVRELAAEIEAAALWYLIATRGNQSMNRFCV